MISGKRVIVGVTGGIAAYKAAQLIRLLQKAGAEVRAMATPSATRFIGLETLKALTRTDVPVEVFATDGEQSSTSDDWTKHIHWGEWADALVIAPCTANTLSKIAHGAADNMLTATVLAARCPIMVSPTMDGEMYENPAVQRNLATLRDDGIHVMEPEEGYLASGLTGRGRLPEPVHILDTLEHILDSKGILNGKRVLVTAGATREQIDPVRFISNPSSGKMGLAMARAAQAAGAEVELLHGAISVSIPAGLPYTSFTSAADLFGKVKERYQDFDIIIMAAAVSDFTPVDAHDHKVKKEDGADSIQLERTQDILAWLGEHRDETHPMLIGFAMETQNLLEQARAKRERKKVDWILANSISNDDTESGFGVDTNVIHIIGESREHKVAGPKTEIATEILEFIFAD
ncbi:MAG: bifunctional phosphopantothenoylcysteine decarboxylase/phosphopantothenate--cysteine ligase CoaBC [Bacteroidota bacterium]